MTWLLNKSQSLTCKFTRMLTFSRAGSQKKVISQRNTTRVANVYLQISHTYFIMIAGTEVQSWNIPMLVSSAVAWNCNKSWKNAFERTSRCCLVFNHTNMKQVLDKMETTFLIFEGSALLKFIDSILLNMWSKFTCDKSVKLTTWFQISEIGWFLDIETVDQKFPLKFTASSWRLIY